MTGLLTVDSYALFYTGLILMAVAATVLLGYGYLERLGGHCEEFYLLLILAAVGAVVLVMSRHFASFFIGLEIQHLIVCVDRLSSTKGTEYGGRP